jgi:hypothetical protein
MERIVKMGIAGQVEIHYNTNGTQFPEHAEDIWQHFKLVEIAFSIDDVAERFEYQRANAVWAEVEHNIARFMAMRDRHPNIQLQVCITISVFNIMYLETVANWADAQGFDFIYWNMLHEARYHCINTLPEHVKSIAANQLTQAVVSPQHCVEFDRVIEFMMNGQSIDPTMLCNNIRLTDLRRNQNLADHHPELALAIGYE